MTGVAKQVAAKLKRQPNTDSTVYAVPRPHLVDSDSTSAIDRMVRERHESCGRLSWIRSRPVWNGIMLVSESFGNGSPEVSPSTAELYEHTVVQSTQIRPGLARAGLLRWA